METEGVWFFEADRGGAAAIEEIFAGGGGVVPIPSDLVQIVAAAVGFVGSLGRAAGRPFPLRLGRQAVAIRGGFKGWSAFAGAVNLGIEIIGGAEAVALAFGVAPFHGVVPGDAAHGTVGIRIGWGGREIVAIGHGEFAHGGPLAPGDFVDSHVEGLHGLARERGGFRQDSRGNRDHSTRSGWGRGGVCGEVEGGGTGARGEFDGEWAGVFFCGGGLEDDAGFAFRARFDGPAESAAEALGERDSGHMERGVAGIFEDERGGGGFADRDVFEFQIAGQLEEAGFFLRAAGGWDFQSAIACGDRDVAGERARAFR